MPVVIFGIGDGHTHAYPHESDFKKLGMRLAHGMHTLILEMCSPWRYKNIFLNTTHSSTQKSIKLITVGYLSNILNTLSMTCII